MKQVTGGMFQIVEYSQAKPAQISSFSFIFHQGDVWICMEVMDTSLDKFYKMVYDKEKTVIPEDILGKIANTVRQT